ncbi:metallopeptidase, putative [Bodo saltans]|uniref:Peptide deformylase n=1 Tax=Bodo saltans TaxID=75058 RepID=A0A0S4JJP7_BODSA|nr:metallopeptidase, putative [Bodo saltans]|eukprot:CUG91714.1 metallopeptidase, putative [Bodo saltans]
MWRFVASSLARKRTACAAVVRPLVSTNVRRKAATGIIAASQAAMPMSTLVTSQRLCSSSSEAHDGTVHVEFPIVQFPARSLLTRQAPLDLKILKSGDYNDMIENLRKSRKHYQYPSLSAPQVGWNVRVFVLYDGSVWVNPVIVEHNCEMPKDKEGTEVEPGLFTASLEDGADGAKIGCGADCTPYRPVRRQPAASCWAWEPCASCAFLMHYIERPGTCRIRGYNEKGELVEKYADGMLARFMLHEMDHLDGVLFTRKIPDTNHVVLLDGFGSMSDWSDDYPSLEARSTFLYTTYTPPYTFVTDNVHDAYLLDRKFEDGIYPGHEADRKLRTDSMLYEDMQRAQWRDLKGKTEEDQMMRDGVSTSPDDEDDQAAPVPNSA